MRSETYINKHTIYIYSKQKAKLFCIVLPIYQSERRKTTLHIILAVSTFLLQAHIQFIFNICLQDTWLFKTSMLHPERQSWRRSGIRFGVHSKPKRRKLTDEPESGIRTVPCCFLNFSAVLLGLGRNLWIATFVFILCFLIIYSREQVGSLTLQEPYVIGDHY